MHALLGRCLEASPTGHLERLARFFPGTLQRCLKGNQAKPGLQMALDKPKNANNDQEDDLAVLRAALAAVQPMNPAETKQKLEQHLALSTSSTTLRCSRTISIVKYL